MSNCSEGPQVPFGDGSHVPLEEITDSDPESDTTIQTVMKNIFLSCDQENNNSALVSDLINFMTPHMQEHSSALTLLRNALDPDDTNPRVNSETFFKAMIAWTSQFMDESLETDSIHSTPVREFSNMKENSISHASSSKASVGEHLLKGYKESSSPNLSHTSTYSYAGSSGIDVVDVTALQEQINELEHQNRKLTEELQHTRTQLLSSEEQNETLQTDIQKITRRLLSEQQMSGQLEKDRQSTEELLEAAAAAQKQMGKLEKDLTSSEKHILKLKQHIVDLEIENQKYEAKVDQLMKRDVESRKLIIKLQAEMNAKEQESASLEQTNVQMKAKLNEQQQMISHYANVNKSLKEDKVKLQQHLHDTIKTRSLTSHLKSASKSSIESSSYNLTGISNSPTILDPNMQQPINPSQENYVASVNTPPIFKEPQFHSPLAKLYKKKGIFNSPRLLHMVAHPVSPHLDNSAISSSATCKKSVDSDNSPVFPCATALVNSVFANTCSTPESTRKTLLDQTLPSAVRKLPLLTPLHESQQYSHKPLTIKKDFALFSQYRFVGSSSSDDEESNCQIPEQPESDIVSVSQIKQEYDSNLNIIAQLEEQKGTPPSLFPDGGEVKEHSLPTMYVVERTSTRSRCKSASSSPSSLRNILDSSTEDDSLFWKIDRRVSPHESLENEISQAKLLENENAELKNTVERLLNENNRLKTQMLSNTEKTMTYSTERLEHFYETECRALKVKVQDLESDNNHKYIKIIDLMEEKELLQKELNRVNGKDAEELGKLKQNISELHHEKGRVLQELEQLKWEKQNADSVIKHLQSVKNECELLQSLLQQSKQNGSELGKEFDKVSIENSELRAKVDKLKQCMSEVKSEYSELNTKLQHLNEEYHKLKNGISSKSKEDVDLRITPDEINSELSKLIKENEELKNKQHNLNLQEAEVKTLKVTTAKHESTIESLMQEISNLCKTNSKLSLIISEKENQISALKQLVNHQNESLEAVTNDRESSTTKLYEQKHENDKLFENIKELTEKNKELAKELELKKKEREYLHVRLDNLEERNESVLAEFKIINADYKNMKDSENKLLKEIALLEAEKEALAKSNEQLANDYRKTKDLKEKIEQQLQNIKYEKDELFKQNDILTKAMNESNSKVYSLQTEINKLLDQINRSKEAQKYDRYTKDLSMIQEKIVELENTNKLLHSENDKLQEDFDAIRGSYECLVSEKEIWLMEKNEWLQLKNEFSNKLMSAMTESQHFEEELLTKSEASEEAIQINENLCSSCLLLQAEIEKLNIRINELQDQNSNKSQGRSYERMQAKIEKLTNKIYGTEEQLSSTKEKIAMLESENSKLEESLCQHKKENATMKSENSKLETEVHKYKKEKVTLESENFRLQKEVQDNLNVYKKEKVNIVAKINILEEQFQGLQLKIQELEQEKGFILRDYNGLKEKLDVAVKEKENRQKSTIKENNQLKQEIQELVKQRTNLEKKLETSQNLLKCKLNVDKISKENAQLKQEIDEANKERIDWEKKVERVECELKEKLASEQKIKGCLESIAKENISLKQQIEELDKLKVDVEKQLEKSQRDLQKSEVKNLSIRKELTDIQSGCDVAAPKISDCKSVESLVQEKNSLEKKLKNHENELTEIQIKLSDSSNCLHLLSEHIKNVNQKLVEERKRLHRSSLTAVSNWRVTLEKVSDRNALKAFDKGEPATPQQTFAGPLDEEMFKFKHQIHVTSLLLDALGTLKTLSLSITSSQDVETQVSPSLESPSLTQKYVKKFNLKTKTESPRSVSPDSPSMGIEPRSIDTCSVRKKTTSLINNQNSSINPDHGGFHAIDAVDGPSQNSSHIYTLAEENEEVETGLYTNKQSYEMTALALSDSTLESLGLLSEGESPTWSKKEIEEKFHILVQCFYMDVVTIKQRCKKQEVYQGSIQKRFSTESDKLMATLMNIKTLIRNHDIENLVTTSLDQLKLIGQISSQISISAVQFGALQHEQRSLKIINVMITHAANLKHVIENSTHRLKSISSSKDSPRLKKSCRMSTSSSSSVQSKEVSSFFQSDVEDCKELADPFQLNEVEEVDAALSRSSLSVTYGPNNEEQLENKPRSENNTNVMQKMLLFNFLVLLTVVVAVIAVVVEYASNGFSVRGYPWRWVSWDDIFAPFVKRTHPKGPPPT